ncbi:MAG: hypothetical protein A2104_03125 [Candidatus Melainabacteria bacterium GWF2_32_7]|nr:MAG: hypothetical protein A2104_03125 [Candidatus Melainabacteria bacterium GWF2_32_7]
MANVGFTPGTIRQDCSFKANRNPQVSFKANLDITPDAKEALQERVKSLIERNVRSQIKDSDYSEFFTRLKNKFETVTKDIKGTAKISMDREKDPVLSFKTPSGDVYRTSGYDPKTGEKLSGKKIIHSFELLNCSKIANAPENLDKIVDVNFLIASLADMETQNLGPSKLTPSNRKCLAEAYKRSSFHQLFLKLLGEK